MMRRYRFEGISAQQSPGVSVPRSRGGAWTRLAKRHKARNPTCAACGRMRFLEADHIVPLHLGGTNEPSNLQSLCRECHALKTAREAGNRAAL